MKTGGAFYDAEVYFKSRIMAAASYVELLNAYSNKLPVDPDLADLYKFKIEQQIGTALDLVDWCWDRDYLTKSEAYNIKHWLNWFNDPVFFHQWKCSEDFRYD